jgi:hypothetical protein
MFACSAYISAVGINQFVPSYAGIALSRLVDNSVIVEIRFLMDEPCPDGG